MTAGRLSTYLVVNALVRDERGTGLVLVREAAPDGSAPRWTVPGGKVEPGESVPDALARELREETGLSYGSATTHAFTVHYLLAEQPDVHAVVHVFDGPAAVTPGRDPLGSSDPDGSVEVAELVHLPVAIERLAAHPVREVREPLVSYLTGARPAGCLWSFPPPAAGGDPVVFQPG